MALKNTIVAIPAIEYDTSLLIGTYALITPAAGTNQPLSLVKFVNNSTVDVTISYDGSTDHDFVPLKSSTTLNFQSNNQPTNSSAILARGTKVYIKGTVGVGVFYMIGYYNPQSIA